MTTAAADTPKVEKARPKATFDHLKKKRRATEVFSIYIADEDGKPQELELKFQSIGAQEYDKLVGKHPPTAEERVEGASFHIDTFAPALISKCSLEPEMTEEEAQEIWNSPGWSRGDLMVLFRRAVELNNRGVDIPFTAAG